MLSKKLKATSSWQSWTRWQSGIEYRAKGLELWSLVDPDLPDSEDDNPPHPNPTLQAILWESRMCELESKLVALELQTEGSPGVQGPTYAALGEEIAALEHEMAYLNLERGDEAHISPEQLDEIRKKLCANANIRNWSQAMTRARLYYLRLFIFRHIDKAILEKIEKSHNVDKDSVRVILRAIKALAPERPADEATPTLEPPLAKELL